MSSEFGKTLKVGIYGRSHGECVSAVISGFPKGVKIDFDKLSTFMARRRGGKKGITTERREDDIPEFTCGVTNGITDGTEIEAVIYNSNVRAEDYSELALVPRPAHADLTAWLKWNGKEDMRGGGKFSGRLTAPLCAAGYLAKQVLEDMGVYIGAHLLSAGSVRDESFPLHPDRELFERIAKKTLPVINDETALLMEQEILKASAQGDSVGAVIECAVVGVKPGLGDALFDGVESRIAPAVFGIPAVKGLEFGSGFEGSKMRGSENNDPITPDGADGITMTSNNSGGILGGITSGMPMVLKVAIKPTPSIAKEQRSVRLDTLEPEQLAIKGRHDACIGVRAVPVIEAVCALCVLDMYLEDKNGGANGH